MHSETQPNSAREVEPQKATALPAAWFYVDPTTAESRGPLDAYGLAGLFESSKLSADSLVWTEGQGSWVPLKDTAELYSQVYHISSRGASVLPDVNRPSQPGELVSQIRSKCRRSPKSKRSRLAPSPGPVQGLASAAAELAAATSPQPKGKRGAVAASKPAISAKPAVDDQLAEFQAEMAALGEGTGATAEAGDDGVRAETPPPEDQEFEDDDGTVYRWDPKLWKFQPKSEAGALSMTAAPDYGLEEMTFAAEEETIPVYQPPAQEGEEEEEQAAADRAGDETPKTTETAAGSGQHPDKVRKRGAEEVFERIAEQKKRAKLQEEAQRQWFDLKVNTSVYITGLPDDISEAQLAERFAQYGVLKPGEDGAPRVKLYRDKATQQPKGDGLVTFLYQPSVDLACNLAGDDYFRPGMAKSMTVQPAKFEMHGTEYVPKKKANKKKSSKEKAKQAEKVLGWGGFDDKVKPTQVTVVLKNFFHPTDVEEEPSLLTDLEADIREECDKLGQVDKVRVFAGNPEGVVSVKFKTEEGARACLNKMQGRYFGGRQVAAGMWDGYTNYNVKIQETAEQQAARLERFAREIEDQQAKEQLERVQEAPRGQEQNVT